jgi:histidine phosphotransferase ChpT
LGFRLSATGLNARVPPTAVELLGGGEAGRTIDAHAVQPFYTGLLARDCGMAVTIAPEGEAIVIFASNTPQG